MRRPHGFEHGVTDSSGRVLRRPLGSVPVGVGPHLLVPASLLLQFVDFASNIVELVTQHPGGKPGGVPGVGRQSLHLDPLLADLELDPVQLGGETRVGVGGGRVDAVGSGGPVGQEDIEDPGPDQVVNDVAHDLRGIDTRSQGVGLIAAVVEAPLLGRVVDHQPPAADVKTAKK
jgi:hypothetical protein